uniref:Ubiquitin-like domain-containing protein n=1 Tax=Pinguiococcus pyrenoidosus TaxID=172671 RepID=A0A7R9YER4_9STRA
MATSNESREGVWLHVKDVYAKGRLTKLFSPKGQKVRELKEQVFESIDGPAPQEAKLIFSGKVLRDEELVDTVMHADSTTMRALAGDPALQDAEGEDLLPTLLLVRSGAGRPAPVARVAPEPQKTMRKPVNKEAEPEPAAAEAPMLDPASIPLMQNLYLQQMYNFSAWQQTMMAFYARAQAQANGQIPPGSMPQMPPGFAWPPMPAGQFPGDPVLSQAAMSSGAERRGRATEARQPPHNLDGRNAALDDDDAVDQSDDEDLGEDVNGPPGVLRRILDVSQGFIEVGGGWTADVQYLFASFLCSLLPTWNPQPNPAPAEE